ncbi:DUF6463 family protein [Nodosilinea sp. AN01ver1]|uniref:DUF6463 family protein n=1 Tax=Nodosilinea sp. AN01ver1 TaxID=3423362 RepID=UPI003D31A369
MQKISGLAIMAIALLHSLIGLIAPGLIGFEGIWQDIAASGVFDAAKPQTLSLWGYYWFLLAGIFLMLCGGLCYWVEHRLDHILPAFVGWGLLAIALFGIGLDLDTGLWLVLPVAINTVLASRASAALPD